MIEDYVRNATLIRAVDADTFDLDIDMGLRIWVKQRVRLLGVNCPELTGPDKEKGRAAKVFVLLWFSTRKEFQVKTYLDKSDSFGRVLAEVWSGSASLAIDLLAAGHAVPYFAGSQE